MITGIYAGYVPGPDTNHAAYQSRRIERLETEVAFWKGKCEELRIELYEIRAKEQPIRSEQSK